MLWLSLRIVTSIKGWQVYLHFTLRCNKSYQALFLSRTKNGCTGSPGRMDYSYFLNGYKSKLFIVWTSKKLRRELRKRQDNVESKKHKHEKGAVHNVTREPTPNCAVCHGPHQVTSSLGRNIHCQ